MKKLFLFFILFASAGLICFSLQYSTSINKDPEDEEKNFVNDKSITKIAYNFNPENEYDLINLTELDTNLTIELKYASTDNFANKQFYPYTAKAMLRSNTAYKLQKANEELFALGYRIKVFDAYRPYVYQQELRDAAEEINPSWAPYIANPKYGSNHNKGTAVDVTLTDLQGRELDMPTKFDYFGKEASINYNGCSTEQKNNRELLAVVMENNGFKRISSEWWHFDDTASSSFDLINVDFNEL